MARRSLRNWLLLAAVAAIGVGGVAIDSSCAQRAAEAEQYRLFIVETYLPQYRLNSGEWPKDLSEADRAAGEVDKPFGAYMSRVRRESGARLQVVRSDADSFEGVLLYPSWSLAPRRVSCDRGCMQSYLAEANAYSRGKNEQDSSGR